MATITATPIGGVGNTYSILRASIDANLAALNADLALKATIASPTLTGTPAAPTAAANTNTTQIATTAFVIGQCATVTPSMDGTADVGTSTKLARENHVHPTDTTRAPLANPTFTGAVLCGSSTGLGYTTGSGGTVTQATSKATAVTLNKAFGKITTANVALAASTAVSFTLTNSMITANDIVLCAIDSGAASLVSYNVWALNTAAGSCTVTLKNVSAASLTEAVVISFCVIKGAVA